MPRNLSSRVTGVERVSLGTLSAFDAFGYIVLSGLDGCSTGTTSGHQGEDENGKVHVLCYESCASFGMRVGEYAFGSTDRGTYALLLCPVEWSASSWPVQETWNMRLDTSLDADTSFTAAWCLLHGNSGSEHRAIRVGLRR